MTDEEKKEAIKRLLEEETVKFLRENRDTILMRVMDRVRQEAKNDGEAQLP